MTQEHLKALDGLGFSWNLEEEGWTSHFEEPKGYNDANDHCSVFWWTWWLSDKQHYYQQLGNCENFEEHSSLFSTTKKHMDKLPPPAVKSRPIC